jgi:hypothetical protein
MQNEFNQAPGFADWYRDKQAWMKTQPLFRSMKEVRDESVHRSDSRPTMRATTPVGDRSVTVEMEFEGERLFLG